MNDKDKTPHNGETPAFLKRKEKRAERFNRSRRAKEKAPGHIEAGAASVVAAYDTASKAEAVRRASISDREQMRAVAAALISTRGMRGRFR